MEPAMTDHVLHPAAGAWRTASPLRRLATHLRGALSRWWLAERTRRELHGLPDEVLRDLGISRGDIDYVARASAGSCDRSR
jgi:uncharacterized protein YjiS (DUF1127 family)